MKVSRLSGLTPVDMCHIQPNQIKKCIKTQNDLKRPTGSSPPSIFSVHETQSMMTLNTYLPESQIERMDAAVNMVVYP